jgi:hypothetical protein
MKAGSALLRPQGYGTQASTCRGPKQARYRGMPPVIGVPRPHRRGWAAASFDQLMPKTLATATVDPLLHHAHVCQTSGESVRLSQALAGDGVSLTPLGSTRRALGTDAPRQRHLRMPRLRNPIPRRTPLPGLQPVHPPHRPRRLQPHCDEPVAQADLT